jgi:hypothetical protein
MGINGGTLGDDGPGSANFGAVLRSRRDPVDGPGSAVDTTPISSTSLPGRSGEGLQVKAADFREHEACLFGWRKEVSILSRRGRFEGLGGYGKETSEDKGLETWGEDGDDQIEESLPDGSHG